MGSRSRDMERARSTTLSDQYPDLHVVFDFFTDNPQKVMPGDVNSPKKDSPYYDPYWDAVRNMQENELFLEGILLRSVDCKPARYPYVHYVVYKGQNSPGGSSERGNNMRHLSLDGTKKRPPHDAMLNNGRGAAPPYPGSQHLTVPTIGFSDILKSRGGYRELHTFVDRHTPLLPKRPSNPNTGYILSAFMTSGNLENLDQTWSYWSGADYIVENIPPSLKLERITFHKILNIRGPSGTGCVGGGGLLADGAGFLGEQGGFSYVLLCELGEALSDLNRAREFIDHLKFRQCGISSLYVIDHFF